MSARATVIIPTFGDAVFARWAIKSVQQQTVKDIEICIICDGSPANMVSLFKEMGQEDARLKVFEFPKATRTGEPYRDIVIKQTTGEIICYCCHDDLWLPFHVAQMETALARCCFTHSIHAVVKVPQDITDEDDFLFYLYLVSLRDKQIVGKMRRGRNFFGLTFAAHTRESYNKLDEGWVTTPKEEVYTDLYMWRKFLSAYQDRCDTVGKITALEFGKYARRDCSEQERADELKRYFERTQDSVFLTQIEKSYEKYRLREQLMLTLALLEAQKPKVIVEIGSGQASNTKLLCQFCAENNAVLHTIDPKFAFDISELQKDYDGIVHIHKNLSSDVLSSIHNIDVALINGDHNSCAIYHELTILDKQATLEATALPLVLFNDSSLYGEPSSGPEELTHDYATAELSSRRKGTSNSGFNQRLQHALSEEGEKSGVTTGVKDFIAKSNENMHLHTFPAFHGFGILVSKSRLVQSAQQESFSRLLPWETLHSLIVSLEKRRTEALANLAQKDQDLANARAESEEQLSIHLPKTRCREYEDLTH